jgi:hypothetical protein
VSSAVAEESNIDAAYGGDVAAPRASSVSSVAAPRASSVSSEQFEQDGGDIAAPGDSLAYGGDDSEEEY